MAKLILIVAVLALVACTSARVSNSVGDNSWKSSSFDGSKLHLFEELGPITQITTLDTLPPANFGSNSYSSCVYDPDADLATFILLEFSSPSDDGDYSLREQIRVQRGGCHSGQPVYIADYYKRITFLERRAQPNSLAFESLLYQSTATAFDATGLGILQRECGSAVFRVYRPVLTTECYATKLCKSRTSWGLLAWTDENTFVTASAESCSIGDIPSDLNYAAPFRKAVLTSDVPVIATTDSSATAVFPCIILLAAMIMALF